MGQGSAGCPRWTGTQQAATSHSSTLAFPLLCSTQQTKSHFSKMPCCPGAPGAWGCGLGVASRPRKYPAVESAWAARYPCLFQSPPPPPARAGAKDTSGRDPGIGAAGCRVPGHPLPLGHPTHPPKKPSQRQKRSSLELKCAVFLKGREMSHRKYYKKGLSLSAVQTLLRPHALYSGSAAERGRGRAWAAALLETTGVGGAAER